MIMAQKETMNQEQDTAEKQDNFEELNINSDADILGNTH
jgi:hypothetical protein